MYHVGAFSGFPGPVWAGLPAVPCNGGNPLDAVNSMSTYGLILLYHRVAEAGSDAWGLCVTPDNFAAQMEVVAHHFAPVRLAAISEAAGRTDVKIPVAVTFDDGYVDNLEAAKPVLSRFGIPATLFVISSAIGSEREFWWEELERILLEPGLLPSELHMTIGSERFDWDLSTDRDYSIAAYEGNRRRRALSEESPTSRHALFRALYFALQPLPEEEIAAAIDALWAWGGGDGVSRPERLPMAEEDYAALAEHGLVDLGAHTATHPLLPAHSLDVQRREIEESREKYKTLPEPRCGSFPIPTGSIPPRRCRWLASWALTSRARRRPVRCVPASPTRWSCLVGQSRIVMAKNFYASCPVRPSRPDHS